MHLVLNFHQGQSGFSRRSAAPNREDVGCKLALSLSRLLCRPMLHPCHAGSWRASASAPAAMALAPSPLRRCAFPTGVLSLHEQRPLPMESKVCCAGKHHATLAPSTPLVPVVPFVPKGFLIWQAHRDTHTFTRRAGQLPEQRDGDAVDYRPLLHRDGSVLSAITLQVRVCADHCPSTFLGCAPAAFARAQQSCGAPRGKAFMCTPSASVSWCCCFTNSGFCFAW